MEWTPQQEKALAAVSRWLSDPKRCQLFRLFGFAGTGKTTLAKHLAEGVQGQVLFAAYTGKAALVLQKAGCVGAQTLHSLIYQPFESSRAQDMIADLRIRLGSEELTEPQRRALQQELDELVEAVRSPNRPKPAFVLRTETPLRSASLLVVDECSMVDEDMAFDLMSYRVPILVLGDPAQLPPVKGEGYFTATRPDIMLTDVRRQAKDNPIIAMATMVREEGRLPAGTYGDSFVMQGRPSAEEALAASQLICGMNKTRSAMNRWVRLKRGATDPLPLEGDRLICLRNDKERGLLNGGMWTCEGGSEVNPEVENRINLHNLRGDDDGRLIEELTAHLHILTGEDRKLAPWDWKEAAEFDYAYAITCHKSQGSQWKHVILFDEWFMQDTRRNWLYTAITRAQDTIKVYRK